MDRQVGLQLRAWREAFGERAAGASIEEQNRQKKAAELQNVADKMIISRSLLGNMENGVRSSSRENIIKLAKYYGRTEGETHWLLRLAEKTENFDFAFDTGQFQPANEKKTGKGENKKENHVAGENSKYGGLRYNPAAPADQPLDTAYPVIQIAWAFRTMLESPSLQPELASRARKIAPSFFVMAALIETYCRKTETQLLRPPERQRMLELLFGEHHDKSEGSVTKNLSSREIAHFSHILRTSFEFDGANEQTHLDNILDLVLAFNSAEYFEWRPQRGIDVFEFFITASPPEDLDDEDVSGPKEE